MTSQQLLVPEQPRISGPHTGKLLVVDSGRYGGTYRMGFLYKKDSKLYECWRDKGVQPPFYFIADLAPTPSSIAGRCRIICKEIDNG